MRKFLVIPALAFVMMAATCQINSAQQVVDLVKKNCGIGVAIADVAAAMSVANPAVVGVAAVAHAICSQAQHSDSGMIVRVQDKDKDCVAVVNGVCIHKDDKGQ